MNGCLIMQFIPLYPRFTHLVGVKAIPRVSDDSSSSIQSACCWTLVILISCLPSYSPLYPLVALGELLVSFLLQVMLSVLKHFLLGLFPIFLCLSEVILLNTL